MIPDVSWIKKKEQLTIEAKKTPTRLDDSAFIRGHTVKQLDKQKPKSLKVNISDSVFNKVIGPGSTVPYNKARLKLWGLKVDKIKKFVGKRYGLDHI